MGNINSEEEKNVMKSNQKNKLIIKVLQSNSLRSRENSPPSLCPPTRPNYSYSGPPNPCSRGNERAWRKARNKTRLPTMHAKMCGKIQRAVVVCACAQSLITTQSDLIFYMSNYFSCVS